MKRVFSCAIGICLMATNALAGECSADQVLTEPRAIENAPDVGVTRLVLYEANLKGWRMKGIFHLRMRPPKVEPHGIVPTHAHDDRPSIVLIQSAEFVEHSTFCAMPIPYKVGDSTTEFGIGHKRWWESLTDQLVILISTDVVPVEVAKELMMDMP